MSDMDLYFSAIGTGPIEKYIYCQVGPDCILSIEWARPSVPELFVTPVLNPALERVIQVKYFRLKIYIHERTARHWS